MSSRAGIAMIAVAVVAIALLVKCPIGVDVENEKVIDVSTPAAQPVVARPDYSREGYYINGQLAQVLDLPEPLGTKTAADIVPYRNNRQQIIEVGQEFELVINPPTILGQDLLTGGRLVSLSWGDPRDNEHGGVLKFQDMGDEVRGGVKVAVFRVIVPEPGIYFIWDQTDRNDNAFIAVEMR
ncbi:MAG: hypothetical protein PHR51_02170 [Patescibacteria group bacterium]|nr:hypothetical protein [Patescibacteria group bacterium]